MIHQEQLVNPTPMIREIEIEREEEENPLHIPDLPVVLLSHLIEEKPFMSVISEEI